MEKPGEYDVVHPIWQRGRDWGIQEERKRILDAIEENIHLFVWFDSDLLRAIIAGEK